MLMEDKNKEKNNKKSSKGNTDHKRKKLFNARRIAAAAGILIVFGFFVLIMKSCHKGPMLPVPEYRQLGNDNSSAILEIYEYTDLACPACAMANEKLHEMLEKHRDKIKLNFKHYPLTMHYWAERAALHADCAGEQGKFFEYADMLFKNQEDWEEKENEPEEFILYAEKLGLDKEKMQTCLNNFSNLERIRLEKAEGTAKGVEGTPSFIINGKYSIGLEGLIKAAEKLDKIEAEKDSNEQ